MTRPQSQYDRDLSLVDLATVYDIDTSMSGRTEDLQMWADLCTTSRGNSLRVVEVGTGNGRIPRALQYLSITQWVGIDMSQQMLRRAVVDCPMWFRTVLGDATKKPTWGMARQIVGAADLVIVPYSTLFLIPHQLQVVLLYRIIETLRPGGIVAIEFFVQKHHSGESQRYLDLGGWERNTLYEVNTERRTTKIDRYYNRKNRMATLRLTEQLYWRRPEGVIQLVEASGLEIAHVLDSDGSIPVPGGHNVVVGRRVDFGESRV